MAVQIRKNYLLTPGPTTVPESILANAARPIPHHRTPQFKELFLEVAKKLQWLFQTKEPVLTLTCSGSGAMEAAIVNLFKPGQTVVVINGGKFGERWVALAKKFGLTVVEFKPAADGALDLAQLEKTMVAHADLAGLLWQASETSTGLQLPTQALCQLAQRHSAAPLTVVDAITALGVTDLPMDAWGMDVLITGSQKALMIPPGLAFMALSKRAWARADAIDNPRFYFDLKKERKSQEKGQTAWTPAISLILAVREALTMLEAEGLKNTFHRHDLAARATRAAAQALGLELYSPAAPSAAVTALHVPAPIADGKAIPKLMRDKWGVFIAGGQDQLEGKIIRLSHLGYMGAFDVLTGVSALELALWELGYRNFEFGAAAGAVLKTYSKESQ
jgi:aspartate aminotransferase-like enzyme